MLIVSCADGAAAGSGPGLILVSPESSLSLHHAVFPSLLKLEFKLQFGQRMEHFIDGPMAGMLSASHNMRDDLYSLPVLVIDCCCCIGLY